MIDNNFPFFRAILNFSLQSQRFLHAIVDKKIKIMHYFLEDPFQNHLEKLTKCYFCSFWFNVLSNMDDKFHYACIQKYTQTYLKYKN